METWNGRGFRLRKESTMLITKEYRAQNAQLLKQGMGKSSKKWGKVIAGLITMSHSPHFGNYRISSVLDYGCGQGCLKRASKIELAKMQIDVEWNEYDPCIEKKKATPSPADLVVCTDVLEHIEPKCLDSVLEDLHRCVRRVGFFCIALRKSHGNTLPDGRNAHLIIEKEEWWMEKLDRFDNWKLTQLPIWKSKGKWASVLVWNTDMEPKS